MQTVACVMNASRGQHHWLDRAFRSGLVCVCLSAGVGGPARWIFWKDGRILPLDFSRPSLPFALFLPSSLYLPPSAPHSILSIYPSTVFLSFTPSPLFFSSPSHLLTPLDPPYSPPAYHVALTPSSPLPPDYAACDLHPRLLFLSALDQAVADLISHHPSIPSHRVSQLAHATPDPPDGPPGHPRSRPSLASSVFHFWLSPFACLAPDRVHTRRAPCRPDAAPVQVGIVSESGLSLPSTPLRWSDAQPTQDNRPSPPWEPAARQPHCWTSECCRAGVPCRARCLGNFPLSATILKTPALLSPVPTC
jgi:hypothetical protein